MWRKLLRAVGWAGYAASLAVLFALVSYAAFNLFVRRGVTPIPELFGLPEEEARALLADQGLKLDWSTDDDRYDEEVPPGHVLFQDPRPGTLVKRGRGVRTGFSRGPQRIAVPAVGGNPLAAAQVTLGGADLAVGRTYSVFDVRGPSGVIVESSPAAGEPVAPGGAVDLFLSEGNPAETYVMPDVVDLDYERVRAFFGARGFRLGRVGYESYAGVRPGTVVRQFPQAGSPLRRGDVISLGVVAPDPTHGPGAAPATPS